MIDAVRGRRGAQARVERGKLDALLGLCETAGCRRQALLAYFGESWREPCGNCDNCLDPARTPGMAPRRRGRRFPASTAPASASAPPIVIDVLRGKPTTARSAASATISWRYFGIGRDLADAAVARCSANWSCGAASPSTPRATARSALPTPPARPARRVAGDLRGAGQRAGRAKPARRRVAAPRGPRRSRLFERLRAWRRGVAAAHAVPAYAIVHDRVLREIAERRPASVAALASVPGIGDVKLRRFGSALIALVAQA